MLSWKWGAVVDATAELGMAHRSAVIISASLFAAVIPAFFPRHAAWEEWLRAPVPRP
jgi:hypothetical protein